MPSRNDSRRSSTGLSAAWPTSGSKAKMFADKWPGMGLKRRIDRFLGSREGGRPTCKHCYETGRKCALDPEQNVHQLHPCTLRCSPPL